MEGKKEIKSGRGRKRRETRKKGRSAWRKIVKREGGGLVKGEGGVGNRRGEGEGGRGRR